MDFMILTLAVLCLTMLTCMYYSVSWWSRILSKKRFPDYGVEEAHSDYRKLISLILGVMISFYTIIGVIHFYYFQGGP